jgi:hypothetical protein
MMRGVINWFASFGGPTVFAVQGVTRTPSLNGVKMRLNQSGNDIPVKAAASSLMT